MTPTKLLRISALSACILAVVPAFAQTTATTTPAGFITLTVPAAPSASVPSNTPICAPLYRAAVFQGAVATTPAGGVNQIQLSGAAFTTDQLTTTPHLVRVKSGTLTGKFYRVASHTSTTLTVNERDNTPGNLTGLVQGNSCEVFPATTLGSLFGTSNPPITGLGVGTSASNAGVDNVLIWSGSNFTTYFYHSGNNRWQRGITASNNEIIFPDDAIFFSRRVTSSLDITILGTVPSTAERTELDGASNNFVANRFPVDTTLGNSGIQSTPGWVSGTSSNGVDNVLLWNAGTGTWDTYFFHSGNNRWQRGITNATNVSIPAGSGYFVVRSAGTSNTALVQSLPYTP